MLDAAVDIDVEQQIKRLMNEHPDTWQEFARGRAEAWEISVQRQPDGIARSMHMQRAIAWRRAIANVVAFT